MIKDVQSILRVCGLGRYLHVGCGENTLVFELLKHSIDAYGLDPSSNIVNKLSEFAPGRFYQGSLTNYPLQQEAFDTVIIGSELLTFDTNQMTSVLQALLRVTKRNIVLYFTSDDLQTLATRGAEADRLFWEKIAISADFRKHPRGMLITPYDELENERTSTLTFFERVPEAATQRFPLSWLLSTRDLHMDMLREAGRRSDGHVSRYVLAAQKIRPGDVVLDAACGLGYGTAVLAACSPGSRFIGVDIDPESIAYAEANFTAVNSAISYHTSDVTRLSFLPNHSVDAVISFETIEHVENYDAFLAEVKRVLKPDGRFLGSVPHMWCDETGNDPNPYHFHVFNWEKLHAAIAKYFIVDDCWAQIAGGGFKVNHGQRLMENVPLKADHHLETEWWIISACANPSQAANIPYTNPFHRNQPDNIIDLIDFEKYYDNPWLYRMMVQLGERLSDRDVLMEFCIKTANEARKGSADHGAALCVLGYQLLSMHAPIAEVAALIDAINTYDQAYDRNNPHAHRWAISLHYIGARLLLIVGKHDDALAAFLACSEMDPLQFNPLLTTKTIAARMYAGLLYVGKKQHAEARYQFQQAIKDAHRALQGDWSEFLGSLEQPLPFGLQEAAEVLELASQCSQALHALDNEEGAPGYFWDRINLKRFGLVEWNKSVEQENKRLNQMLSQRYITRVGAVA